MNALKKAPRIYLAGGMRSGWQQRLMTAIREKYKEAIIFLDPCAGHCAEEVAYTNWDLTAVETCDIIFAYLEKDNPGGHGLALEVGFAVGMANAGAPRKHIIFVNEPGHVADRYMGMTRVCSDVVVDSFEKGVIALEDHLIRAY